MQVTTEALFTEARTARGYLPAEVPDATLQAIYELMKFGPTSGNCTPLRIVFVRTAEARDRLVPCMDPGSNQAKVRAAPVTAILGTDLAFPEKLPRLFPSADAPSWYAGNPAKTTDAAIHNAHIQVGYFIIAARALGLDAGPMGGFDGGAVDAAFWPSTPKRSIVICTLGHGDASRLHPRDPRLAFDEACSLA
ncbi:MAG TPA: malonic semialdehyde reductase [Ideonella sp.]|uniref:malonic semialdehyde reductase n=1 Tax=Ideonella sp. TaxID=1929293 RepID=UPI002E376EB9|nr:malonic semialdehyde reductase [Ideonella sp.]HEX5683046.1 malonic semialdehyde reductase [Ideonella sp.]